MARIKWERIKDGDSIRKGKRQAVVVCCRFSPSVDSPCIPPPGAWSSEEELKLMTLVTEDNNNDSACHGL